MYYGKDCSNFFSNSRGVRKGIKKYSISEAEVIKRALINEVKRAKELEGRIDEVADMLKKIPHDDVVKSIREDRENR